MPKIVKLTRMGTLDMQAPDTGFSKLMKKLRGSSKPSSDNGAKKMRMLRRLPKILKLIPGKAQDLARLVPDHAVIGLAPRTRISRQWCGS